MPLFREIQTLNFMIWGSLQEAVVGKRGALVVDGSGQAGKVFAGLVERKT